MVLLKDVPTLWDAERAQLVVGDRQLCVRGVTRRHAVADQDVEVQDRHGCDTKKGGGSE